MILVNFIKKRTKMSSLLANNIFTICCNIVPALHLIQNLLGQLLPFHELEILWHLSGILSFGFPFGFGGETRD